MKIICRKLYEHEFEQALAIRFKVFVDEQKVPVEEERDSYDTTAVHFGAFYQNQIIGTGRVIVIDDKGKIGRLAVLKQYRGLGIGMTLINTIVDYCKELGLREVCLGAQLQAIPFYEKAGFKVEGDIFDDAGIPHRTMGKKI